MKKGKILIIVCGVLTALGLLIVLIPPSAQDYYEKGRHALLTGKYEEAHQLLLQAINKSRNPSMTSDALMSLATCLNQEGDSAQAREYIRRAALMFNKDAQTSYGAYLDLHKELIDEFVSYYTYLNEHSPQKSVYAGKLARIYLFETSHIDYNKAGELLMPFVSRSGSGSGDPNTLAYAAYLLAEGKGGYVESPEVAVMLSSKCNKNIDYVIENPNTDAEALLILGNMALAECAYDATINMLANINKANKLYRAALDKANPKMHKMILERIEWIDDFCTESQKVVVDPLWWNKKPNDWTQFFNHETGFRYLGHTNESGHKGAHGGNEYPTGWGIGAWTKDGQVFLGKWKASKTDKGIYAFPTGVSVIRD